MGSLLAVPEISPFCLLAPLCFVQLTVSEVSQSSRCAAVRSCLQTGDTSSENWMRASFPGELTVTVTSCGFRSPLARGGAGAPGGMRPGTGRRVVTVELASSGSFLSRRV